MARLEVPVQLRWADMDAYAHVNNVAMLRLLEEARIQAFWRHPVSDQAADAAPAVQWPTAVLDAGPGADVSTLVARQEIEYLHPLPYRRRPVIVEMWLGYLGGASIDVCYEVRDDAPEPTVYARAVATLVLVDTSTGSPRRISEAERVAWQPYVEGPISFRRRR
ncbi:MAG: 4-hydroxybenzoyl-CoA thioesterase [Cellulomonas sp. 73-145]|uniref:acyl-CoA thioesterase n=1 Tax=Cellulomonas sp. 73-145 TaxID=1895739 RepID=UPI000929CF75|nr:thioesterase family protein [Cellulomonas sp. 73-145]MBN9326129.1 acyl-CoA thioesterase [Cellulomonas sp.]OJV57983.1 MAG: 4-hydroxybenzoyl-CoA thioesterase [Cellulomonas sp. 73-145]